MVVEVESEAPIDIEIRKMKIQKEKGSNGRISWGYVIIFAINLAEPHLSVFQTMEEPPSVHRFNAELLQTFV